MTRGDLHIHTRRSDGSYCYREALLLARRRGLSFVSFTDHDVVDGVPEAVELGRALGVTAIPGVEISAWDGARGRKVHILGYGFDAAASNIRALCAPMVAARHANTLAQLDALIAAGYPLSMSDLEKAARGSTVYHKQHLMKALIDAGLSDGFYGETYRKLFKGGGPADIDIRYVDARDAVRAVLADGGIPVLAHPAEYDSWELVPELVEVGLRGIELFHETHRGSDHERVLALASRFGLLLSGGSDDHGDLGSSVHIGQVHAPDDVPMALLARDHPAMGTALALVTEAASRLRAAAAEVGGAESKGGDHRDLVTRWDAEIESYIVGGLTAAFPGSRFIAEEQADGEGWVGDGLPPGMAWILDPIDGTTNFADSARDYAVCLALYVDGAPELALVLDCERERLYSAVAGAGAKVDGRRMRLGPQAQAPVPPTADAPPSSETPPADRPLRNALVEISLNSIEYLSERGADFAYLNREIRGHRAVGSAALGICRIAEGALGAYASGKLGVWDWAAADLILREAGGSSWLGPSKGGEIGIRAKGFYMAAASKKLGEALLGRLADDSFLALVKPTG